MILNAAEIDSLEEHLDAYVRETRAIRLITSSWAEHGHTYTIANMAEIVAQLTPEELNAVGRSKSIAGLSALDVFLAENPHLFIPHGFDEIRIEPKFGRQAAQAFEQTAEHRVFNARERSLWESHFGLWCRDLASGVWHRYGGIDQKEYAVDFRSPDGSEKCIPFRDFVKQCKAAISSDVNPAALLLPRLWRPPDSTPSLALADTTRALIRSLAASEVSLDQLKWQELEDIVAEILRSRGLHVTATPRTSDGGRDVIARGELLPGEPTTLAVEIKHQDVVTVDSVRSRLYANREFPILMLVTSGRFSAGVIDEKKRPENFLRLILKDGKALRSWIDDYASFADPKNGLTIA